MDGTRPTNPFGGYHPTGSSAQGASSATGPAPANAAAPAPRAAPPVVAPGLAIGVPVMGPPARPPIAPLPFGPPPGAGGGVSVLALRAQPQGYARPQPLSSQDAARQLSQVLQSSPDPAAFGAAFLMEHGRNLLAKPGSPPERAGRKLIDVLRTTARSGIDSRFLPALYDATNRALSGLMLPRPAPQTFMEAREAIFLLGPVASAADYKSAIGSYLSNKRADRRDEKLLRLCEDLKPNFESAVHSAMVDLARDNGLHDQLRARFPTTAEEARGMLILLGPGQGDVAHVALRLMASVAQSRGLPEAMTALAKLSSSLPPGSEAQRIVGGIRVEPAQQSTRSGGSGLPFTSLDAFGIFGL